MKAAKIAWMLVLFLGIFAYYKYDLSKAKHRYANASGKTLHAPGEFGESHGGH